MPLIGVGMSALVARWRKTVSAAMNPTADDVDALYLIVEGPVSSASWRQPVPWPPCFEDFVAGLQVTDRRVERNAVDFTSAVLLYGLGGSGARFGCASVSRRRRFASFVDLAVALGEFLLQHLKLLLLRLQSLAKLFELRRDGCIGALSLLGRLGFRRLSRCGRL